MKEWKQPIPTNLNIIFGKDFLAKHLYQEFLLRARVSDGEERFAKTFHFLKRGECVCGLQELADEFRADVKTVKKTIVKLQDFYNKVEYKTTTKGTVIAIINYDEVVRMGNQNGNQKENGNTPIKPENLRTKTENAKNAEDKTENKISTKEVATEAEMSNNTMNNGKQTEYQKGNKRKTKGKQKESNKNDKNEENEKNGETINGESEKSDPPNKNIFLDHLKKAQDLKTGEAKPSPIVHSWQDKALRYAEKLQITMNVIDPSLKARWFKLFKDAEVPKNRYLLVGIETAISNLSDQPSFRILTNSEAKIMYFFKVVQNK